MDAKQEKPVAVEWEWLSRPVLFVHTGNLSPGRIRINDCEYEARPLQGRADRWRLWMLAKEDGQFYDIDLAAKHPACDCADATYRPARPGGCKHLRAMQEAVSSGSPIIIAGVSS